MLCKVRIKQNSHTYVYISESLYVYVYMKSLHLIQEKKLEFVIGLLLNEGSLNCFNNVWRIYSLLVFLRLDYHVAKIF